MKEPKKIYIDNNIWQGIVKIANLEGLSIGDFIAKLFNDKYAWVNNNAVSDTAKPKSNKSIKEYILECLRRYNIPKNEYHLYDVLYCKECLYIEIRSKYTISPWYCSNNHKYDLLGDLSAFLE
jgi:hypothetical protein